MTVSVVETTPTVTGATAAPVAVAASHARWSA